MKLNRLINFCWLTVKFVHIWSVRMGGLFRLTKYSSRDLDMSWYEFDGYCWKRDNISIQLDLWYSLSQSWFQTPDNRNKIYRNDITVFSDSCFLIANGSWKLILCRNLHINSPSHESDFLWQNKHPACNMINKATTVPKNRIVKARTILIYTTNSFVVTAIKSKTV